MDAQVVIIEREAEVVRNVFSLYVQGNSLKTISERLNMMPISYAGGDRKWDKNMVKRILENKKYIGDKDYPVIIPPETAELALKCKDKKCAEISENDKIKLDMYRAKACCAICGAKMKRSHAGSGERRRIYWQCTNAECDGNRHLFREKILDNMLLELLNELTDNLANIDYAEDKTIITKLAMSEEENIALHFNTNQDAFTKSLEIGDGIYVFTNTSTQSKLYVLNRLFKLYDEDPADLVFYLRDENETNEDEPGSRYELRRKYWTCALPIIQKAHGEDGSFSNVNPSRGNWINGFFGIGGFYLCCVANYDAARAEVVFGRGNKQENKDAFDGLYTHKAEIESALGTTLQWNRGDDIKSSKVFIQLNNVSIENETDWIQMANFHADWTKKFYDVIVPFIKQ